MAISSTSAAHAHAVLLNSLTEASNLYPKEEGVTYSYGTAGFRTLGAKLPAAVFRTALLAVLRSKRLEGASIGVMITASHNPEPDNGVKIVDPSGEMLDPTWEQHATALSNCPSTDSLISTFTTLATHLHVDLSQPASIIFARDTRPSGPDLVKALEAGLHAFGDNVKIKDVGVTTTPILHYVVKATNDQSGTYGAPTIEGYMQKMSKAFKELVGIRGPLVPLFVDCANGVGSSAVDTMIPLIEDVLLLRPMNTATGTKGALNDECGADYVKTKQAMPPNLAQLGTLDKPGTTGCSFDGDADRIVFYYVEDATRTFKLLDGDKIATMVAVYFKELLLRTKLTGEEKLSMGVVQTAYANGSSTKYLESRDIPVECVQTGVKHLHHAAKKFDIGIYFEANGHGTVLFSPHAIETLRKASPVTPEAGNAIRHLLNFYELINQAVGDAMSDMLLVEAVLAHKGWGSSEWNAGYQDLPNKLEKVIVPDRNHFVTYDAERRLNHPVGLQELVDVEVGKYEMGRAFVRPSGTEDCVRVYAEAKTKEDVEGEFCLHTTKVAS
ncbi:hypothetical protein TREMEDRAFT_28226 [Tremella mesenterica DSM 1558]|uniref:uncharacterized protein n=1 Tax=Tremella mesenterica (strain ATCC 24925 / CBS 8224 / DSM 1558 / NBRC 9311 / NRRL Y-6157 / RJB 2259-6 / UBC 559-6) TaxID=578456 RepID=UPI0003F48D7D|nr:uncharacterized protein TREMEDRAFT_28226 [Tremella mesenterica DSM 1558]EIW71736.1 hypothetical protein TREMEDRAFT_28226 [Tremella mesenterica DSM 1558]